MTKLEAKNIVKYFNHDSHKLKALGGINLKVEAGDFVCLVGPSGCGKSTFLRIVAGLEKPDEGEILFDGRNVTETGPERIMVFQEGALFPWLKVQDNVEFGLKMAGIPKEERAKISHRYLDMMQLTKFADEVREVPVDRKRRAEPQHPTGRHGYQCLRRWDPESLPDGDHSRKQHPSRSREPEVGDHTERQGCEGEADDPEHLVEV